MGEAKRRNTAALRTTGRYDRACEAALYDGAPDPGRPEESSLNGGPGEVLPPLRPTWTPMTHEQAKDRSKRPPLLDHENLTPTGRRPREPEMQELPHPRRVIAITHRTRPGMAATLAALPPDPELKGRWRGNCNRRACQQPGAVWFNRSTRAYYCQTCAYDINRSNPDAALHMPSLGPDGQLCVLCTEPYTGE